jgi:hypothetical protein
MVMRWSVIAMRRVPMDGLLRIMRALRGFGLALAVLSAGVFACAAPVKGPQASNTRTPLSIGAGMVDDPSLSHLPAFDPGPNPVRRLTNLQYENSVRWALGLAGEVQARLGDDRAIDAYSNGALQAIPSVGLSQAYAAAAARLAQEATLPESRAQRFDVTSCRGGRHPDCLERFVRLYGRRLFRRPLASDELAAVLAAAREKAALEGRTTDDIERFWAGAAFALEIMLQSVPFLYVIETGERNDVHPGFPRRTPHEVATRLALLLWNGGPDDRLLDLADAGGLRTRAEIDAEVARMLKHPRAQDAGRHFFREWLGYDLALGAKKEWDVHKEFRGPLVRSLVRESDVVVGEMLSANRPVMDIFGIDSTPGDSSVRQFYRMSADSAPVAKLPPDRRGILSLGAYIMANSGSHKQSPTQRGLSVLRRFLCDDVGSPPPSAPSDLPDVPDETPRTIRERTELFMLANDRCSHCHEDMDNIGFLFEHFDVIGKHRTTEVLTREKVEKPVNALGAIPTLGLENVPGLPGLAEALSTHDTAHRCMLRNVLKWSLGRDDLESDARVLAVMDHAYKRNGRSFDTLMRALATSDTLLYMRPQ